MCALTAAISQDKKKQISKQTKLAFILKRPQGGNEDTWVSVMSQKQTICNESLRKVNTGGGVRGAGGGRGGGGGHRPDPCIMRCKESVGTTLVVFPQKMLDQLAL